MRTSSVSRLALIFLLSLFGSSCLKPTLFAQEVPFAPNTGVQPPECQVKGMTKIANGTQPDWSRDGRLIAYTDIVQGDFELFRMNPDGSSQRCLTCGDRAPKQLLGKHKGVPTLHPDGKYVLFVAENEHGDHSFRTTPGFGEDNDFWVTDPDGANYWRLTSLPKGSALQFPRFSFDGKRFLWSDRYQKANMRKKGLEYGLWKLKLADFVVTQGTPRLANIIEFEPGGKGYYEPHGFSPDGKKIIFTAMIQPGKSAFYGDIYTYDLASRTLINLTKSDDIHDEQALYSPSGNKISYMSGPFIGLVRFGYKTDLYLMDPDGTNRARLTHFNQPGHPDYTGANTLMNKHAWSPDGTQIVSGYYIHQRKEQKVFLVTFRGPCGKP